MTDGEEEILGVLGCLVGEEEMRVKEVCCSQAERATLVAGKGRAAITASAHGIGRNNVRMAGGLLVETRVVPLESTLPGIVRCRFFRAACAQCPKWATGVDA